MNGFHTLTLAAALTITSNLRAADRECLDLCTDGLTAESYAISRWQTNGAAWHFEQDGVPVAMGGISQTVPWCGYAWMVVAEGVTFDSWKKLLRFARTVFGNASKSLQRIEAHVLAGWTEAEKYAPAMGFTFEAPRRNAARDGRDILVFVILGEK